MEKREPFYTVGGKVSWCSHCGNNTEVSQKLKLGLLYDPAIQLLEAGSQREESRPWQRSWRRKPNKMQRRDLASGVPPEFSWTSTSKNQSLPALLYCAFHSPDILWKKLTQGFSLVHMKGMFQLKPLWWVSNLPDRFPWTFTICELLTAPQPWEAQSLRHLKDTEPYKELKIILVMGFHCWLNDCCQASIFLIF